MIHSIIRLEKTLVFVEQAFDASCYQCHSPSRWSLFVQTEWVSLFTRRVIPLSKCDHIVCEKCRTSLPLNKNAGKKMEKLRSPDSDEERKWLVNGFKQFIQLHQLQGQTSDQRVAIATDNNQRSTQST